MLVSMRLLKGTKAIESDGTMLYSQPSNAWQEGIKTLKEPEASTVAAQTVFGLDWGVIISDEVQGMRTLNRFYTACRMLRPKSEMVIGMSATPGITSPMVRRTLLAVFCALSHMSCRTSWRSAASSGSRPLRSWVRTS